VDEELPLLDAPVPEDAPPAPLEVDGPLAVVAEDVASPPAPPAPPALVVIDELPVVVTDELPVVVMDELPVVTDEAPPPPVPPWGSGPGQPASTRGNMEDNASNAWCIVDLVMSTPGFKGTCKFAGVNDELRPLVARLPAQRGFHSTAS
jgi:hypothetical protein